MLTDLGNSCRPSFVLPPGSEKKLRPSSALRWFMLNMSICIKLATHEGSRMVTYLPGASGRGSTDAWAFSIDTAPQRP